MCSYQIKNPHLGQQQVEFLFQDNFSSLKKRESSLKFCRTIQEAKRKGGEQLKWIRLWAFYCLWIQSTKRRTLNTGEVPQVCSLSVHRWVIYVHFLALVSLRWLLQHRIRGFPWEAARTPVLGYCPASTPPTVWPEWHELYSWLSYWSTKKDVHFKKFHILLGSG